MDLAPAPTTSFFSHFWAWVQATLVLTQLYLIRESVGGHGGGRKLSYIDVINTTIYYRKFPTVT